MNWKQRYKKEATPYHVSPSWNRESIEEKGLRTDVESHRWDFEPDDEPPAPGELGWIETGVYMSPTDEDANEWAKQIHNTYWREDERDHPKDFDLYYVDTTGIPLEEHTSYGNEKNELISRQPIGPERIKHVKTFNIDWSK